MIDSFTRYKEGILLKYEEDKLGKYARFLVKPTRAGLRDLSMILLKEERNVIDKEIFESFLGFEFGVNSQRIKKETDKFRPLASFLRQETSLSDIAAADMAALLVDFQPRPYSKYLREVFPNEKQPQPNEKLPPNNPIDLPKIGTPKVGLSTSDNSENKKKPLSKKGNVLIVTITVLLLGSYAVKNEMFPAKECMQWNSDHYEEVVCEGNKLGFLKVNPVFDRNEDLLSFKKIEVCDTTTFFRDGEPLIWYIKQNGECEYFNAPGLHPVSGKPLRPITSHIIEAHIMNKNQSH